MRHPPIELHRGELRVAGLGPPPRRPAPRRLRLRLPRPRRPHRPPRPDHRHPGHPGAHEPPARRAEAAPQGRAPAGRLPPALRPRAQLTLELFPAGHVLGSAQLRITLEDGRTLGYTGDLCTDTTQRRRAGRGDALRRAGARVDLRPAALRLPAQGGDAGRGSAPSCDDALSDGVTPVLYGYALGKAQEILAFLAGAGYACRVHPVVHAIDRIYEAHGVALPGVRPLDPEVPPAGEVVVVPQQLAWSPAMQAGDAAPHRGADRLGHRRGPVASAASTPPSRSPTTPTSPRCWPTPGPPGPRGSSPSTATPTSWPAPCRGGDPGRAAAREEPARASVVQGARDRAHRHRRRRRPAARQVRPQGPQGRKRRRPVAKAFFC